MCSAQQQVEILPSKVPDQALVGTDDRVSECPLRGLQFQHLLLDRVANDQSERENRPLLSDSVSAVDRAHTCMPLRGILRFLQLSPSRFHAWRRRQRACVLDDQASCPRS